VRDLFALSSDYDATDKATQMFFAETQTKLLYAVTQKTAAEIVVSRADASRPNMALTYKLERQNCAQAGYLYCKKLPDGR